MAKLITRYVDSAARAAEIRSEMLYRKGFPAHIVRVYDKAEGLAARLIAAEVRPATAEAYQARMAGGGAVIVVRAGYKPLGVAKMTRETLAAMGVPPQAGLVEEVAVKDDRTPVPRVLAGHPLVMTRQRDPNSTNHYMANWPLPLIIKRGRPVPSAIPPHARMAAWPIPLLMPRGPSMKPMFPPHARMANFPIPLISKRQPSTASIFPRHARMANFPIPLISRRKPYTGSLFPRHQRMAPWPFPLLINGKTGTNALMPGAPRMANFPIPLISKREPSTASIFPRHARMANFPIPLISKREPSTASIFPRHARMADFPIPLLVGHSEETQPAMKGGFSISKMFGIPTVIRR